MMKTLPRLVFLILLLGFSITLHLQAQTKQSLTLMPFTSVSVEDEETIAVLLANEDLIRNTFSVIPSTSTFNRIVGEIQTGNYNAADSARKFNADFVITIHTKKLRNTNLLMLSIINTKTMQLLGGDYRKYNQVRELRAALPEIITGLISATQSNKVLPKLTVLPFYTSVSKAEAEIWTQLMTIDIANSGQYSVFPWDLSEKRLDADFSITYSGIINPDDLQIIGRKTNVPYVLTGDLLGQGTMNLFMASIVNTQDAHFLSSGDIEYRVITDDISMVTELSGILTSVTPTMMIPRYPIEQEKPLVTEAVVPKTENIKITADVPAVEYIEKYPEVKGFVHISGGTFRMGSLVSEVFRDADEEPHEVAVAGFYMGKYEVTQEEYEAVMGTNPSRFKGATLPVEQISWFDAVTYCNARSAKEGLTPAYTIKRSEIEWNHDANGYRLPSEDEWEYACRAGTITAYNTGNNITINQSNYDGSSASNESLKRDWQGTTPVGSFLPNAWGLYDMHGNVYEWCWDQYKPYAEADLNGDAEKDAVIRGGGWESEVRFLRSAKRMHTDHGRQVPYIGFRVVRSIPETR